MRLRTPVAFLVFNRPDTTERVFETIAAAKPSKLLVVADGPRRDRLDDAENCEATRAIIQRVDWECEVLTNFAQENMGCRQRVSSGLTWVFEQVEQAIILEDDCQPHPDFFRYCDELLDRFQDDERVMAISGDNFQFGHNSTPYSYYFSRYCHVWGWATWRRAWNHYDVRMTQWPELRDTSFLRSFCDSAELENYWRKILDAVHAGEIDTWDYQWAFACWIQSGLTVLPGLNMISNIGFGGSATHTTHQSPFANMAVESIGFPLVHPPYMVPHVAADAYTVETMFMPVAPVEQRGGANMAGLARRIIRKARTFIAR
jgi:hypothetical protein